MIILKKLLGVQPLYDEDDDVAASRKELAKAVKHNREVSSKVEKTLTALLTVAAASAKPHGD